MLGQLRQTGQNVYDFSRELVDVVEQKSQIQGRLKPGLFEEFVLELEVVLKEKRQAETARQKHIAEMKALAAREAQVWRQVETLLDTGRKIASVYDEATALLAKLEQLAEFQDTRDSFQARLHQLAQEYASRPSLIKRWKKRGWTN